MKVVFVGNEIDRRKGVAQIVEVSIHLRWPDATIEMAQGGISGLQQVGKTPPRVVILNPNFPDMPFSEFIREIRKMSDVPILVLAHRREDDLMQVLTLIEAGADVYVRLPCTPPEIMERIWALLRRTESFMPYTQENPIRNGDLLINPATQETYLRKQFLALTRTEFIMLYMLATNPGKVIPHGTFIQAIWNDDSSEFITSMRKHMEGLRRKISDNARNPEWIESVRGVGYRFIGPAPQPAWQTAG